MRRRTRTFAGAALSNWCCWASMRRRVDFCAAFWITLAAQCRNRRRSWENCSGTRRDCISSPTTHKPNTCPMCAPPTQTRCSSSRRAHLRRLCLAPEKTPLIYLRPRSSMKALKSKSLSCRKKIKQIMYFRAFSSVSEKTCGNQLEQRKVSAMVEEMRLPNLFELGISVGCSGEALSSEKDFDSDKLDAAMAGIIEVRKDVC